jgi:hypothetical protein
MLIKLHVFGDAICKLAKKNVLSTGYEVKNIKLIEKKSCKVPGCDTISGAIKMILISQEDKDKNLVISLSNPCVTHGLSKLVVENWCAVGWLYADTKTKKRICHRREFFKLSADLEFPVDNIIDKAIFWCSGCGTNKISFADDIQEQERQIISFCEKECQQDHSKQVIVAADLQEKVMDILFDEDASMAINVQKLYIAYRHFGVADLYNCITLILCSDFYDKDYSLQMLPTEVVVMICRFAWGSRWESFNKAVTKEFDKYLEKYLEGE